MQDITEAFKHIFRTHANTLAIIDHIRNQEYSYKQLEDLSSRLAGILREYAGKNAKIGLLYSNQMEMVIGYLACLQLGATAIPMNPDFHPDEIAGFIRHAEPDLVLTSSEFMPKLGSSQFKRVVRFGLAPEDEYSIAALPHIERLSDVSFPYLSKDMLAYIMFTSGSTGVPKAIPMRFHQLAGQAQLLAHMYLKDSNYRLYLILPLAYVGGLQLTMGYLFAGGSVVIDHVFSTKIIYRFWDTVLKYQADSLWLTPSMIATLLAVGTEDETQAKRISTSVRSIVSAMGPLPTSIKEQFEKTFGVRIQKSYGITETLLCCTWKGNFNTPVESVGSPVNGMELIIASEDGELLPVEREGEIRVKGQWVMESYYNQPEQTKSAFDERGYFRTGDLGRVDKNGNVFITGRIKDVIKRGGLNISPAEIENVLVRMENIKEAAVIGIPDNVYGEKIVAVISTSQGAQVRLEDVTSYCLRYLSEIKIPSLVHVIDQLPLSPSGKPDKRAIKAMITNMLKQAS